MPLPDHAHPGSLTLALGDIPAELRPDRTVFLPAHRLLLAADLHLGKARYFRNRAIAVPEGSTAADLARLGRALDDTGAERLVILGDLIHHEDGIDDAVIGEVARWRQRHPGVAVTLVRGNHDRRFVALPEPWGMADREVLDLGRLRLVHQPDPVPGRTIIGGHLHPGVRLNGRAGDRLRLPCFVVEQDRLILPAFGELTGLMEVPPANGRQRIALAGEVCIPCDPEQCEKGWGE